MHAGRGNAHEDVADLDFRSVNEFGFFHDSGGVSGNVIFAVGIHARHFCRFSADKGTSGLAASFCDSGYDCLDFLRDVFADCHIVQEEKWFSALCKDVVYAHCHGIDADGVVLVHCKCQFKFGSDAVGSAYEYRLLDIQSREVEHSAERSYVSHHAETRCRSHMFLDTPYHVVSGFKAYACFFVINCHSTNYYLFFNFNV